MKKTLLLALALCLVVAGAAFAGLDGSSHDLGDDSLGTTEVCVFCHHPHGTGNTELLWNLSDLSTTTFGKYSSGTLSSTTADVDSNATGSIECMHCHDGVVSAGALIQGPSTTALNLTGNTVLGGTGTALVDDHPVNFTYTDAGYGAAPSPYKLFASGTKMQCGTCHEVHNDSGNANFTRGNMANSQMCDDCHNKL